MASFSQHDMKRIALAFDIEGEYLESEAYGNGHIQEPDDVVDLGSQRLLIRLKAVSWMWPLPVAFLVTLLSAAVFSVRRRSS